jgi:hypothetical protein
VEVNRREALVNCHILLFKVTIKTGFETFNQAIFLPELLTRCSAAEAALPLPGL